MRNQGHIRRSDAGTLRLVRASRLALIILIAVAIAEWALPAYLQKYDVAAYQEYYERYQEYGPLFGGWVGAMLWNGTAFLWRAADAHHNAILSAFTVALAVGTVALAAYTAKLWGATRRLVEETTNTAKMELRAYVNVFSVAMVNAARREDVHIVFKNFGQTPAKNIRLWREMGSRELPLVGRLKRSTIRTVTHGVIAPGDIYKSIDQVPLLSDGEEVVARKKALYVWGELRYVDAFNSEWITRFQYLTAGPGWTSDRELYVCEDGNDAT